jgi:thioredoxin-like negative regulator of GroEL
MVDPRRLEPDTGADTREAADRESQTDALLVEGLDRYFTGRYEDAIHLWTRLLFLDRNHAKARAYIDRARTALAERQRRSEEMLQASRALLEQGETEAARDLLAEAVAQGGEDEHAAALRHRLERVERLTAADRAWPAGPSAPVEGVAVETVPGWSWRQRPSPLAVSAVLAAALLLILSVSSGVAQDWLGWQARGEGLRPAAAESRIPVLSSSDVALVRARTLAERGQFAEALRALDRVSPDSAQRPAVDRLKADIQQLLLAGAQPPGGRPRR